MDPEEEARLAAEAAARAADDEAARVASAAAESEEEDEDDDDGSPVESLEDAKAALLLAKAEAKKAKAAATRARKEAERFKGIDPEKARADAKAVADAEKARIAAEKAAATAEGNFERLRELQNEEATAAIEAANARAAAAEAKLASMEERLNRSNRAAAFANSNFVTAETILSPAKAERLYGDHVEIEDGEIVVYDAPAGANKRTKIMDARGNPLPFDQAIRKVVEADPDKDTILRSAIKPGASSKTDDPSRKAPEGKDRISRIAQGLKALNGN